MIYLKRILILFQWTIRVLLFIILSSLVGAFTIALIFVSIAGLFLSIALHLIEIPLVLPIYYVITGEYYYSKYNSIVSICCTLICSWNLCIKKSETYEKDKLSSFYEDVLFSIPFLCFNYGRKL